MNELNKLYCSTNQANTGVGNCVLIMQNVVGAIIVPLSMKLGATEFEDLQATLVELTRSAVASNRIFPVHGFEQMTDNTEEKTVQSMGYGGQYPVREGFYNWMFQYLNGGLCLHKRLRTFNGKGRAALFYDAQGVIFGRGVEDDGETKLAGIPLEFMWTDPWRPSDGSNVMIMNMQFVFKPRHINEDLAYVKTDFQIDSVVGLQDLVLASHSTTARPVIQAILTAGCSAGDINVYETFGTDLAAPTYWLATVNGAAVAITSVAVNDAISGFTITVDVADENYSAGAPLVIKLAGPAALETIGMEAYESNSITIPGA